MQPSSLIFLVIVAIWVAYLVQHWVRRREHLATARSVDKFSEAMRLLERKSPIASTVESGSPGTVAAAVSSPLRARVADRPLPPAHPVPPIELVPHRSPAQVVLRRVRGVLFLVALAAVPVTVVLSAAHVLKWLSVAIALAVLVAAVVWLRVSALQEQAARRSRREAWRRLEEARSRLAPSPRRPSVGGAHAVAAREGGLLEEQTPEERISAEGALENTLPGGWKPVPVPRPTYTLKEPAHRLDPPARPSEPVPVDVPDGDLEDELDVAGLTTSGPRRAAGR